MFGLGKKKGADESEAPAPEQGGGALSSNRARVGLLALVLIAGVGYLAYEYLPDLLDSTPPPVPVQAKPKPKPAPVVVAKAPAPQPVAVAPKPEGKPAEEEAKPAPEPVAMEPKTAPEPMAKAEPAAKPEPMVTPMLIAQSDPPAKPEPMAKPAEPMAKPAEPMAKPAEPAEPMAKPEARPVAPMLGPPPITPKYNDVMTAVLYGDRAAVAQLLDLGRWVDKPDSNGLTPLMAAVLVRDADMVQLLLDRGADPNLQAPGGEVALEMARRNGDGASESQLLRAGAKY
jgi:hypothetical protein